MSDGLFNPEAFEQMPGQMSMEQVELPPSANGYALKVNDHVLTAAWAAPFYTLAIGYVEDGDEPMLIHCETLDDARRTARRWQGEVIVLDAAFERMP